MARWKAEGSINSHWPIGFPMVGIDSSTCNLNSRGLYTHYKDFLVQVGWPSQTIPNIRSWDSWDPGTYEWVYNTRRADGKNYTGDKDDQKEGQLEMNKNLKKKTKDEWKFRSCCWNSFSFFLGMFWRFGVRKLFLCQWKTWGFDESSRAQRPLRLGCSDPTPGKPIGAKAHQKLFFWNRNIKPMRDPWDEQYIYLHEWLILVWQISRKYIPFVPWMRKMGKSYSFWKWLDTPITMTIWRLMPKVSTLTSHSLLEQIVLSTFLCVHSVDIRGHLLRFGVTGLPKICEKNTKAHEVWLVV